MGSHLSPNWFSRGSCIPNLEVFVFQEGGKSKFPEKNLCSKVETNKTFNPHMIKGRNKTRGALVGGESSHHSTRPAHQ